jgi:hypothetical protein
VQTPRFVKEDHDRGSATPFRSSRDGSPALGKLEPQWLDDADTMTVGNGTGNGRDGLGVMG